MPDVIHIALVDDHPFFREGVRRALRKVKDVKLVAEGTCAADACRIAREDQPDIMLLDITMPGGGLVAAQAIAVSDPTVKIVMLTGSDSDEHFNAAIAGGARGYILKGANTEELLKALRTVHSGGPYVTPELSNRLLFQPARAQQTAAGSPQRQSALTSRDQQLMDFAAQGLTNTEIATEAGLALPTVKNAMSRIYEKLGVRNRAEAISIWLRKG